MLVSVIIIKGNGGKNWYYGIKRRVYKKIQEDMGQQLLKVEVDGNQ